MKEIICLDTGVKYCYSEKETPYSAMTKMLYYLNIQHLDKTAKIDKTESGLHLYFDHCGKIYAIRNN